MKSQNIGLGSFTSFDPTYLGYVARLSLNLCSDFQFDIYDMASKNYINKNLRKFYFICAEILLVNEQ